MADAPPVTLTHERRLKIAKDLSKDAVPEGNVGMLSALRNPVQGEERWLQVPGVERKWLHLFKDRPWDTTDDSSEAWYRHARAAESPAIQWSIMLAGTPDHGITEAEMHAFLREAGLCEREEEIPSRYELKPSVATRESLRRDPRALEGLDMTDADAPLPYQLSLSFAQTGQVDAYVNQLLGKAPEKTLRIAKLFATDAVPSKDRGQITGLKAANNAPDDYKHLFSSRQIGTTARDRLVRTRMPRATMPDRMAELAMRVGLSDDPDAITYGDLSGFLARTFPEKTPGVDWKPTVPEESAVRTKFDYIPIQVFLPYADLEKLDREVEKILEREQGRGGAAPGSSRSPPPSGHGRVP